MTANDTNLATALSLLADCWEAMRRINAAAAGFSGEKLTRLPDLSLAGAERNAATAKRLLERIAALDEAALPHPVATTLRQARYYLQGVARQAEWYWLALDPAGLGFYGLFAPSAYCGGFVLNGVLRSLSEFKAESAGDADRYLAQVADLAQLIDQMTERTLGQRERGILVPKPQLPSVRGLLAGLRGSAAAAVRAGGKACDAAEIERRITQLIEPAFERLAAIFDAAYEAQAPAGVGIGQYPGGAAVYAELVRRHTTMDLTPEQVHQRGLARMAEVQREMAAIRAAAGCADDAEYMARASRDPRYAASTVEGVTAVFKRYIDRMDAVFDQAFHARCKAPHGVAALPAALEASMTFGYYDAVRPDGGGGNYMFNAANLTTRPLLNIASLTYHELVPGHHLHLASQTESRSLHPIARYAYCNAYNEGWAEYAATLAGELGGYEADEERYGRLMMDAFLSCRLVVDTGMNALGWSLEQARDYLRRNGSLSEPEVLSESLRYSCDIPGQSLAYKLGDTEMLRLRERMRAAQGERFALKDFHAAVLGSGAMPFPDLAWSLERLTAAA
ncbi:DUF885 family protein [Pelomonas sp. KK5]|uniref:DUF885 domain-containing protein n=1 Tax=Pelomonas sp. KK5 TaxID=1855730 RepID=UPI001301D26D|nr:DUF885 domain-containing protein [Pelomonas sp. KK5]